ncbi:Ricin B lectin [Catenulispora acidiphila DSM 44928]|uniref:Ricin B lectin n=1 Tax=Catenulispora acidiphila (strain DSM 44928 / JCM 14897 / NBRC 102108 / NRRL B-24433 / ID139908) TaxID=479433 RepID=C7Q3E0_CATAD|nr:RICIN domain-containing protein [Catenulispora acidiphila]ACU75705.1 Ricin B lectin [Catenulispora acidiphila DSM 44928]
MTVARLKKTMASRILTGLTGALLLSAAVVGPVPITHAASASTFSPGAAWKDQNGNALQMHGLGIVKSGSTWYAFGEDKKGESSSDTSFRAIPCYSSTDLQTWTYHSSALSKQASGDLGPNRIVERPKVIYNASTRQYVMYMHIDSPSYSEAKVGVATSSTPCGPYTYRGSFQPLGFQSKDEGLYQDTDGTAYLMSRDPQHGLRIDRLSADYLSVASNVALFPDLEAPAMMKSGGRYYLLASHLSGWKTNDNVYAGATSLSGPWTSFTDFAPAGTSTYNTQTANIIPVSGSSGTTFIYAGDRWNSSDLGNSPLVWLPITVSGTTLNVGWFNSWSLDVSAGTWTAGSSVPSAAAHVLASGADNQVVDVAKASKNDGAAIDQWPATGGANQSWNLHRASGNVFTVVSAESGECLTVSGASTSAGGALIQWPCSSAADQLWAFDAVGDYASSSNTSYIVRNLNSGLVVDIPKNSTVAGTALDQWTGNGGANQVWRVS